MILCTIVGNNDQVGGSAGKLESLELIDFCPSLLFFHLLSRLSVVS